MRFEFWFAKTIAFKAQRKVSGLVVVLGILTIALGVAVMEVSISLSTGFKREIRAKVVGFGSHIQISKYLGDQDSEFRPVNKNAKCMDEVRGHENVVDATPFVLKTAMIKSDSTLEGIALKGVDTSYRWNFFQSNLKYGNLPDYGGRKASKEILISKRLAELLAVEVGNDVRLYFLQEPIRQRKVKIAGIYESGMEEFDLINVICDMRMLQRIDKLKAEDVTGFEVWVNDFDNVTQIAEQLDETVDYDMTATSILDIYPEIFDWLDLQHNNVYFILVLMILISLINMTSVILILIIERTQTIGMMKALGMGNFSNMLVFMFNAFFLVLSGVLIGNLLGLGLIFSQDKWGWFKVDQANYFVREVPVAWAWPEFGLINLGVMIVCTIFMLFPTLVVLSISPLKAIRFD